MSYDPGNSIVRIIDKTQSTPIGITEGGLIDGDLLTPDHVARIVWEEGDGKTPNMTLMLFVKTSGIFVRTAPILTEKESPDKYLIEIKIAQNGNVDKLQRYRLSAPALVDDPDLGEVLSVPCESIAYEPLKESLVSINDELVTPKQRIINILEAWNNSAGNDKVFFNYDPSDIDISDSDALQFDYTPTTPKSVDSLIQDVISRLKEAGPIGGVFKNIYYRTEANPILTRDILFKMEEFGNTDSGVVIDPDSVQAGTLEDRLTITSNKRRKKVIVVKYNVKAGSLPTEHAEFRSRFLHASFRREWDVLKDYLEGDPVKWTDTSQVPNIIRFFKATTDVTGGSDPNVNNSLWFEDFTLIPPWNEGVFYEEDEVVTYEFGGNVLFFRADNANGPALIPPLANIDWTQIMLPRPSSTYQPFFSPSPWTNNLENFKANIDGKSILEPSGYAGVCVDWNFARILNDIPDYTNRFQTVTGKDVREILNTPPVNLDVREYDGVRYLVGTSPTGDFAGHTNQIAEFAVNPQRGIERHWEFSLDPIEGDIIYDHNTGIVFRFDGNNWLFLYNVISQSDKPGPVHAVKNIKLVKDASGIPGQAVQLQYNWKVFIEGGGDDINASSRGVWIAFYYPTPIENASVPLGSLYGGTGAFSPTNPYLNHINLDKSKEGLVGWNNGKTSESQGRISEHTFKVRVGVFRSENDDSIPSKGHANFKMVYWRKDHVGRFFFKDYTIPENNGWHPVTISLPPFGPSDLYFSRLDELYSAFGFTLPYDFFIKEKEFSGAKYEWRKNQVWGTFMKGDGYNNTGLYVNNYTDILRGFQEAASQSFGDAIDGLENAVKSLFGEEVDDSAFDTTRTTIHHTTIAICELHYIKEGYAIFPETTGDDPRYELVRMDSENDYLTAKAKSESTFIENDFFPNERHVGCFGDVRIRYGELITETGVRVPGGTLESAVANMKHTIDNKGFKTELFLVRKFVI